MTSSCDSGFVAPLTSAQAAAAPPTPSKSTGNSALAYFNRKFAAGQNAGPPPPVDNHHILRLDRDHTQASHYEPEPVGVLIGSQSEILSSRSEKGEKDATGGFDWSFGFMAGEETKHESPPSFSSSPGKSVLVATDSGSMQQPPSNTKTKSAGAPEASIASSNSQVQNSYTPRKNNHSFARKKEASQQNVQMYKPTRDGRAANSSKQSADASSSSNAATSTWGSWF